MIKKQPKKAVDRLFSQHSQSLQTLANQAHSEIRQKKREAYWTAANPQASVKNP